MTNSNPSASEGSCFGRGAVGEVVSFLKTLAIFLAIAFFLRASVVEAFKIPSGSMRPTLIEGDHILVSKLSYGLWLPLLKRNIAQMYEPKRGAVVVFTRPNDPSTFYEDESSINIIKRVVGIPGDTIEVGDRRVYINGQPLEESYARWAQGGIPEGRWGPEVVPEGHVFLLGDNRDHSRDSRFWGNQPFLEIERIKGRALIIYWSWSEPGRIGKILR